MNTYQYFIVQIINQIFCLYTKNALVLFSISIFSFYIFVVFLYHVIKANDEKKMFIKEVITTLYLREAIRVITVYAIVYILTYVPVIIVFFVRKSDIENYFVVHQNILIQGIWVFQCVYLTFCSYALVNGNRKSYFQVLVEGYIIMKNNILTTLITTIFFLFVLVIQILFIEHFESISEIFIIIHIPISLSILFIRKKFNSTLGH